MTNIHPFVCLYFYSITSQGSCMKHLEKMEKKLRKMCVMETMFVLYPWWFAFWLMDGLWMEKEVIVWTLLGTRFLKDGQIYFKILRCSRCKISTVFGHFSTLCIKSLIVGIKPWLYVLIVDRPFIFIFVFHCNWIASTGWGQ